MIVLSLFSWWYGEGWKSALQHSNKRIYEAYRLFSVAILVQTLFAPWRRIISAPGAGVGDHIRAAVDNTVSRFVGFFVRIIVLLAAMVVVALASIISLFELLLWPFVPILPLVFLFLGVIG